METVTIKVTGMTCGGCVKSVTNVLQALPGVKRAEVSLEKGEARVEHESSSVGREEMMRAVTDAGFDAA